MNRLATVVLVTYAILSLSCSKTGSPANPTPAATPAPVIATITPTPAGNNITDAARDGDLEAVKRFLAEGVPAHTQDKEGKTALHLACSNRHLEVIEEFMVSGTGVSYVDKDMKTPLDLAKAADDKDVVELLEFREALFRAIRKGEIAKVEQMLKSRPKFLESRHQEQGWSPLIQASRGGRTHMVEKLLDMGADINATGGKNEEAAIHWAAWTSHVDKNLARKRAVVKLLLARGADVNTRDKNRETPLFKAGTKEMVELLIENGADVNARNHIGWISLRKALLGNQTAVAELLLAKGADAKSVDDCGDGLLSASPNVKFTKKLIEMGAPVNASNDNGTTALHMAVSRGMIEVAKVLVANGADINAKDADGKTPLASTHDDKMKAFLKKKGGK